MKWEQLEHHWNEFRQDIKDKWALLNDVDLGGIGGSRDVFLKKLQSVYGFSKERAARELKEFLEAIAHKAKGHKPSKKPTQPPPKRPFPPSQHPPVM